MWAKEGTLCGCEALARWDDPKIGFLSPGMFIPILEEGRQIHKLDLCIFDQVCKRIRDCIDNNMPVLPVSLNFSRLDFELMDAVGELEKLVKKYEVDRKYLHVEITESALTEDIEGLKKAMKRLHDSGYVIWLDDFGSGYSSLNVLKDFNFDLLKIDMEFLKNFSGNEKAHVIVGSIIRLADQLGMMTLTEGVETEEAVEFLKQAGCGRLQGYFYGKPMPYEDILERIKDGNMVL
jgi:EAL domain-containing protein (putative c-di-GMP-specific phosphodiesterase class I)